MEDDQYQRQLLNIEKQKLDQDPNSIYSDSMREEKVTNIIQQLNPDNLVEDIEHRIRGEKKNRFTLGWEPIDPHSTKRISDKLVENYVSFLSSLLTQNTSLSNFSSNEINNLMFMIIEHVRDDLPDNAEEYGFVKKNTIVVSREVKILKDVILPNGMITKVILGTKTIEVALDSNVETDFNEMNRIAMIICGTTYAVFKRAQNGMEARRIFGALKVSETLNQSPQSKGFVDALKFWKS